MNQLDENILTLAPLSAIERDISNGSQFDSYFPLPDGKVTELKKNADVSDTVLLMIDIINDYHLQCVRIAKHLRGKTIKETAENVWNFVFKYLKYNIEKGEILRTPAATWYYAQVKARDFIGNSFEKPQYSADCDCFSIFICSIAKCLNLTWLLRITAYNTDNFQHVYPLFIDEQGKPIIVDAVYHEFNKEKSFTKKNDFDMNKHNLGSTVLMLSGLVLADDVDDNIEGIELPEYAYSKESAINALGDYLGRSARWLRKNADSISNGNLHCKFFEKCMDNWNTSPNNRLHILRQLAEKEQLLKNKTMYGVENNGDMFWENLHDTVRGLGDIDDDDMGDLSGKFKNIWNKIKTGVKKLNPINLFRKKPANTQKSTQQTISESSTNAVTEPKKPFYKTPLGIGAMVVGGVAVVGGLLYFLNQPKPKALSGVEEINLA